MSLPDDLGVMRTEAWDDLQRYLNRFEEAWKYAILHDQQPPDLNNYIPPFESQARGQVHVELVKTDLEYRWKQGQTPDLDSYIIKYKELGSADTVPASLIFEEYRIRLMHGVQAKLGDYQKRFPVQYAELQKLVESHPSVRPTPSLATSTPAPRSVVPKRGVLDFAPGAIIEGFELLQLLDDRGGFGEVWKAREQNSGVCFAVKRTKSSVNSSDVQRVRESLELLKGKELKNPYLLQIHRWFEYGRKLCIVMELASGGDLKHRLVACKREGQRGIPVMELFKYFKGLAEALDYLHDEGIQHRDIKPQNILLIEGVAKLADFDLVKEMAAQRIVSHTMGGTPAYQAPEMFDSDFVNRKSDQYCFAYTYTELRLGKLPFHFGTHKELRQAHQNDTPNLEALPVAEREVLHKALAKKPQKRFDTCTAFIMALREAVGYTEEWQASAGFAASAIVDFGRGAVIKGNNNLYELLDDKPIGEGGFGEVWKVRRQSSGGNYAIKRSKSGMDTDEVKRVLTSLQLFKDKNNPHLLQAIEWFRYGRKLCIVMELASGSLKERLTECKRAGEAGIPVDELLEYFKGLAEALDYLHGLGIQHRDIKPENILLVNGVAKLADFDLAKQMAKGRNVSYTMGGTVAYQAPEMFDGEFVDRKSDQYCFAYGYAELRLGKLPFDFSTQKQLREAHLQKAPPLDPLPAAEQEVLLKALAKKPQHRFASCMEFYQELEQAVRAPKPATARPGAKPATRKPEPQPLMPSDNLPTIKPQRPAAAGPVVGKTVLEPGARPVRQTPAHDRGSPTKDTDDGSIRPGTVVVGDPALKTGVRQSPDTVEHHEQQTLKPRPAGRNPATDAEIRIKPQKESDQWHDPEDGERGGAKKWVLLGLMGVLLIGGVIGGAMMIGTSTKLPSPPTPPTLNCDDERAAVTAAVDKLRQQNKFDDAFGELDAFAAKQPQCAAEVVGLRLPLCEGKIDWLTTQDNFQGAFKEVRDRADLLGDKQAVVQTKVFVALKTRLDGSKDKPHDYVLLEIVALYKNLLPEQQRPVLEWVKMAHAEMLGAANLTLKEAVACVADYGKTFGPAPSSWQCLVEMDKSLTPAGGGNADHTFERYLALVKSPPEGKWDVPMEKLTGRLLKLAEKDEKTMLALLAHKSDLSEHLNGMGLSDSTKGAMVTLLDTGLNKKYLVEAALAYAQKNWAGCQQALEQIADKNTLLADQKQEHDALLALADAQLGKNRMQSSNALLKLLTQKDQAPAKRLEEMWNVLGSVQANSFTLTTPQLLALEGAMAYAPVNDQPRISDHFFALVNQFMKTTDVAKSVGPLKAQFDSVNKAQATYDRLNIALKMYGRAGKAAPLERQIDLVLAAANAKVKDADERAFVVSVASKLLADKAVFAKAEHAKALYPVFVAYAELLAEPSAKVLAYCDLLDRISSAGVSEIGLAELSTEVLKKAIDLRASVGEKDKPALARLMAYQAGLIVDNKDAPPKWPYADPPRMAHDLYCWAADLDRTNVDYVFHKVKTRADLPKVDWDELAGWAKAAVNGFPQDAQSHWADGWVKLHNARLKKTAYVKKASGPDDKLRYYLESKAALDESVKNALAKGLDKGESPVLAQILLDRSQVSLELGNYYAIMPYGYQQSNDAHKQMQAHFGDAAEDAELALKLDKLEKRVFLFYEALGNACEDLALYPQVDQEINYLKAKEAFEKAKKIDDKRPGVRTSLGRVLVNLAGVLKDAKQQKLLYDAAEAELKAAIACAGDSLEAVEPTYFLARVYRWRDGDLDKAIGTLQEAKKLNDKLASKTPSDPLHAVIAAGYAGNATIEAADLNCIVAMRQLEKGKQDAQSKVQKLKELIGNNPGELQSAVVVLKHKTMLPAGMKATVADVKELENNVNVAANNNIKMWSNLWLAFEKAALEKRDDSLAQFREGFTIAERLMDQEGGMDRLKKTRVGTGYEAWADLWEFYGYAAALAYGNGKGTAAEAQDALAWVRQAISIAPKERIGELQKLEKTIQGK